MLASPGCCDQLEAVLAALEVLPLEPPANLHYATVRWHLAKRGETIGPNDLLIAAHALTVEAVLATANVSEFRRVPNLQVLNCLVADER